jgi:predicted nucleic acid-binding Zn ribbon protein
MTSRQIVEAENRVRQGLPPYPDYEVMIHEMVEARTRQLKRDSWTTAIMFFLVGILLALVAVIVLLEVNTLG